ncbi:MAG: hypothetical protein ACRD2S_07655, partial [Terriglobales bacterium]
PGSLHFFPVRKPLVSHEENAICGGPNSMGLLPARSKQFTGSDWRQVMDASGKKPQIVGEDLFTTKCEAHPYRY